MLIKQGIFIVQVSRHRKLYWASADWLNQVSLPQMEQRDILELRQVSCMEKAGAGWLPSACLSGEAEPRN